MGMVPLLFHYLWGGTEPGWKRHFVDTLLWLLTSDLI